MTAHRRDDQQARRIGGQPGVGKAQQIAERAVQHDGFFHSVRLAIHHHAFDLEARLAARGRGVSKDFQRRCRNLTQSGHAHGVSG